jgi:hypothetical protein
LRSYLDSQDSVVLGGTHDKDQWDIVPRKEDAKFILDGCTSLFPSLEVNAKQIASPFGFACSTHLFSTLNLPIKNKKTWLLTGTVEHCLESGNFI